MSDKELKPCPFCGERAETDFIPRHHSYQVECSDSMGCTARIIRDSELGAIEAWNCRAALAAAPAQDDALTAAYMAGRYDAKKAAPTQAGEYPELPDCGYAKSGDIKAFGTYTAVQMHAYADATCAAREAAQAAPVDADDAEKRALRKGLHDAAKSLETISLISGRDAYMLHMDQVRSYAATRAEVARGELEDAACAAQKGEKT